MAIDERLSPHFYLSHLTVSPLAGRAGLRNEPLGHQVENLRRLAKQLELVQQLLGGARVTVLRAFRPVALVRPQEIDPAAEGRSCDFIAPEFGSPREIVAHLVANGIGFDRLINADNKWVQLDIPAAGIEPRKQLQIGVFEHGKAMRYMECQR